MLRLGLFIFLAIGLMPALSQANSASAKQALNQAVTNPICASGNNADEPFRTDLFEKDQFKGSCADGVGYVECLRQYWQNRNK